MATQSVVWSLVAACKRAHNKLTISGIALDVGIFEKALSKIGAHRPKDLF